MNLIRGKLLDNKQSLDELDNIENTLYQIKLLGNLPRELVLAACQKLADSLSKEEYIPQLIEIGIPDYKASRELFLAKQMLSRKYLESRLKIELGSLDCYEYTPMDVDFSVKHCYKPLGVLFHIVAGNVDALPVFSVIEGLLTGNINILKLPGADNGLSIRFLQKLISYEPKLADYIFVFDYPSSEVESIKKMAEVSDAIVVWGGDTAVSSVRKMANPNTKIIEWGHKISFAYVSDDASDTDLEGIAYNICDTNQLFCSSCQGIYLDSDNFAEVVSFAKRFLKILNNKSIEIPLNDDPFLRAQKTLESYTENLESIKAEKHVLKTKNCGIVVYNDSTLTPSFMYRHCWIKPLPKHKLLSELSKYKNHLQTVGLACDNSEKEELVNILSKTGIVCITSGKNMSVNYCGMPHDGDFSLARYMKVVSIKV